MGKKHGDKQKNTPKSERRERLLDVVETIEDDARASFDLAFERLEQKAAQKLDKIVSRTRRDADEIGGVLRTLVEQAETSSRTALEEVAAGNSRSTARVEETLAEVEDHRRAMHELFAVTEQRGRESLEHLEALLEEVGGRASGVSERLEDLSRHHEEVIGRATARASEQISLGESAVAERARGAETEIGQRIADLIAIAERDAEELRHRARARVDEEYARLEQETQEELGRVIGRMRADVAHADAETEEWQARRETVAQLVDGVVERTRVAGQRVAQAEESSVGELRESVERVRAEVARVDAEAEELRSRRVMLDELDDALVEAASESWQRVAAVEESSVEELQGAAERVRALTAQADADGEFVRARLGTVEQLVDGFVERTRDAGQRVGEVEESSVGELRETVQRVRATVDAEAEELRSRRAMLDELDDALVEAASESWQRVAAVEETSVGQLHAAAERVRVLLEQADADGEALHSRRGTVEELVDGVVEHARDVGQRVAQAEESSVGELRESVERVRAEVARVDAEAEELRSRRVMLDELDDALVEAASESWQRVAAVEASSVGEVRESVERVRALLEQAELDGDAVHSRRGTVEELVEGFVERTREAGQRVVEVEEASVGALQAATEQVRALMAQAEESSVGELRESVERVRAEVARVDAEAEELRSRRVMLDELDDALVEAASESWQRVAAVEASSVGEVRESVERIRARLEQAELDGDAVHSRRGTVEELVEGFVERTREAGQRVGEVEEASVGALQAATEQVRALMAQADADGETVRARLGMVEELLDGLVERTRDAGQRVGEVEESSVGALQASVEQVRTELARIDAETRELRSRREQIQALDEQLVDALVEAASESWQRVAVVEERSVGELQGATERVAAYVVRAEADSDDVQSRRETVGQLVDALTARARDFGRRMAEVEQQSIDELRRAAARISEFATQTDSTHDELSTPGEPVEELREIARPAWDPGLSPDDDAIPGVDGADDAPEPAGSNGHAHGHGVLAALESRPAADDLAEPGPDDGTAAAEEQPEPEPHRPALVWTPTSPFDDSEVRDDLDDLDDPDDPDFFRRLAAEIREDARGDDFFAESYGVPESAPSTVATSSPHGHDAVEQPAYEREWGQTGLEAPPRSAVTVTLSCAALCACVERLLGDPDRLVRLDLKLTPADREHPARVRVLTYDPAGWWEWYDIPAHADAPVAQPIVVGLTELSEAVATLNRFGAGVDVALRFDEALSVGNTLLLAADPEAVPAPPAGVHRVEAVDLRGADRGGLVVETQLGRFVIPPRLVAHIRKRHGTGVDLVAADDLPFLSARGDSIDTLAGPRILARLSEPGADSVEVIERRTNAGNEATDLVAALSATTPPSELERLLKVGVGYVRRRVASHPSLPEETITELVKTGTETMRAAAAANVGISAEALDLAAADSSPVVRGMAAANPGAGARLEALAADPVAHVRVRAATNPSLTAERVRDLAADDDSWVRAAVAARTDIDPGLLVALAHDPDPTVCAAVAANPTCPTELLEELVGVVPLAVLANRNASESLLTAGTAIGMPALRATVASNPETPAKSLRRLARDQDPDVLRAVVEHPQTPAAARRRAQRRLGAHEGT